MSLVPTRETHARVSGFQFQTGQAIVDSAHPGTAVTGQVHAENPNGAELFGQTAHVGQLAALVPVPDEWCDAIGAEVTLDGVLIGAGDGRYLAVASALSCAVFLPLALLVWRSHAGVDALWWAFDAFMFVRLATLAVRYRGDRWLVVGADHR